MNMTRRFPYIEGTGEMTKGADLLVTALENEGVDLVRAKLPDACGQHPSPRQRPGDNVSLAFLRKYDHASASGLRFRVSPSEGGVAQRQRPALGNCTRHAGQIADS
jgi:hypothetical protein